MSIERFIASCRDQLREAIRAREAATDRSAKSLLTRKINDLNAALVKAERKGVTE